MITTKRKELFERITLIGPLHENDKWFSWCYRNGYSIKRSGPKRMSLGRVDMNKFKIIAERKAKEKK